MTMPEIKGPLRPLDELMAEIEAHLDQNEPEIRRRIASMEKRRAIDRVTHLKALAETASKGGFGAEAKRIWAIETQNGTDLSMKALQRLGEELRRGGYQRV